MNRNLSETSAREAGFRYLSRREYSALELRRRLLAKGYPVDVVSDLIQQFRQEDLLSDRRFAESLIRRRCEQGYGPIRIRAELTQLGVDPSLVTWPDMDWVEVIQRVFAKRYRNQRVLNPEDLYRCRRYLMQRGFDSEQISRCLRARAQDGDTPDSAWN